MWPMSFFPKVKTCCCCVPLRGGTLLIGVNTLISGAILMLIGLSGILVTLGVVESEEIGKHDDKNMTWIDVLVYALFTLLGFVYFLASLLLLIGTCTNDPKKVTLWLKINVVLFVVTAIQALLSIFREFIAKEEAAEKTMHIIRTLIISTLILAIHAYFILVVNSYYQENS